MEQKGVLWEMAAGGAAATAVAPGRFEKELLRVGRWVHPAGKFVLEVTRDRLLRWAESFKRMLGKGIRVPVPYGHSYDPRDNAGFVTDMRVEGERLVGVLEIPRDEDAARLGSVATDVSISVNPDFVDGQGERFGEVIEHVAITNYPVVSGQENFVPLSTDGGREVIRLALEKGAAEGAAAAADTGERSGSPDPDRDARTAGEAALLDRIAELERASVDGEIESYLFSGKISPAVEPHVRRILSAGAGRMQLSAGGDSIAPAEELRAILAAMPAGAWVPIETRFAAARPLERRDFEVSDERARKLAAENAALLRKGGEGDQTQAS